MDATQEQARGRKDEGRQVKSAWTAILKFAYVALFAGSVVVVGICVWKWGAGDNLLQKINNQWPLFPAAAAPFLLVLPMVLGRKRWRRLMAWKRDSN